MTDVDMHFSELFNRQDGPSAMFFAKNDEGIEPSELVKVITPTEIRVCYSTHSSYSEIIELVKKVNPRKVIPCVVPPGSSLQEVQSNLVQATGISSLSAFFASSGKQLSSQTAPPPKKQPQFTGVINWKKMRRCVITEYMNEINPEIPTEALLPCKPLDSRAKASDEDKTEGKPKTFKRIRLF